MGLHKPNGAKISNEGFVLWKLGFVIRIMDNSYPRALLSARLCKPPKNHLPNPLPHNHLQRAKKRAIRIRVVFGELVCRLRNQPTSQLTHHAESSRSRRFAFLAFLARVSASPQAPAALSFSRETDRGPKATVGVASAP